MGAVDARDVAHMGTAIAHDTTHMGAAIAHDVKNMGAAIVHVTLMGAVHVHVAPWVQPMPV